MEIYKELNGKKFKFEKTSDRNVFSDIWIHIKTTYALLSRSITKKIHKIATTTTKSVSNDKSGLVGKNPY